MNLIPVVLAEKVHHRRALHYLVEAGGTLPLGALFGIRIFAKDDNFIVLQLVSTGINAPIPFSIIKREKIVIEKEKEVNKHQETLNFSGGSEELF